MLGFLHNSTKAEHKELKKLIKPYMERILSTGRCSPEDGEALEKIGREHKVDLDIDNELRIQKALWKYDNGKKLELEPLEVNIELKEKEICYSAEQTRWRLYPTSIGADLGSTFIYVNSAKISEGQLYVTNQRLIFVGAPKSATVNINKIEKAKLLKNNPSSETWSLIITDARKMNYSFEQQKAVAEYSYLVVDKLTSS